MTLGASLGALPFPTRDFTKSGVSGHTLSFTAHYLTAVTHALLVGFVNWVAVGYWMPIPPGEDIIVSVYSFWLKVQDASGSQSTSDANTRFCVIGIRKVR